MCLYTNRKEPYIAKEPIYVYKILLKVTYKPYKWLPFIKINKYITPYYKVLVKNKTLIASDINKPIEYLADLNVFIIEQQAVHAYSSMNVAYTIRAMNIKNGNRFINKNTVITLWKIPKGIKYWIGNGESSNQIAAQKMKFIKEIH